MPYKDPEQKRENDRKRAQRARERRLENPEVAQKEALARRKYINNKYRTDPEYKLRRNRERVAARYGLTRKGYAALLEAQNHACAICKTPHIEENNKRLFIDHDHEVGHKAVRGLLCSTCNLGIGYFKDNPDLLRAAAEYLERNNEPTACSTTPSL
jgi:hypothetical protein